MVTEHTNTVYNCGTCAEPKYRDVRHGDWLHIRHDSLCEDALAPVPVKLRIPARHRPHTCTSQCDRCHTLERCVEAVVTRGELLLCASCADLRDLHMGVLDAVYAE